MLKIHDWEQWQSYRSDRGQPPWIKIHRELMRNVKWVGLSDSERGQLVSIWILAADNNGEIPEDEKMIMRLCYMTTKLNINKFIQLGFVDANTTPTRRQHDSPETETKTETKTETEVYCEVETSLEKISLEEEIFNYWKNTFGKSKTFFTPQRKKLISAALKTGYGSDILKQAIDGCKISPWHQGDNPEGKKYNSLELIFRSAEKIDNFVTIADKNMPVLSGADRVISLRVKAEAVGMKIWEYSEQEICESWNAMKEKQ